MIWENIKLKQMTVFIKKVNLLLLMVIITIGPVAVLFSCDEFVPYEVFVDNQTNDTIKVVFKKVDHTYVCLPQTITPIYQTEGRATHHYDCDPGLSYWEAELYVSGGKTCKKDILNKDDFTCSGKRKKGYVQTFIVTEDDLE